tara:strand:+ start:618 stop:791 length:174 start_codon:yes stop_codon:yes gene_type:complete
VRKAVPRKARAINLKADRFLRDGKNRAISVLDIAGVDGATDDSESIKNSSIIFIILP